MASSTNGAGPHPVITHPPAVSASGNSAPVNVFQVVGLERAAGALEASSVTNRILLVCCAIGCLVAIGLSSAALVIGLMHHSNYTTAITAAAQVHQDSVRDFSEWAAKTYNREVAIDADALLAGTNYRAKFGEIPVPPNAKAKRKGK